MNVVTNFMVLWCDVGGGGIFSLGTISGGLVALLPSWFCDGAVCVVPFWRNRLLALREVATVLPPVVFQYLSPPLTHCYRFNGAPYRSTCLLQPTSSALVNCTEWVSVCMYRTCFFGGAGSGHVAGEEILSPPWALLSPPWA